MNYIGISFLAIIPALLLCWYIYSKDRIEKEPFGLLALLFVAGAVVYFPAIFTENALIGLIDNAFACKVEYSLTGVAEYVSDGAFAAHSFLCGIFAVALIEESFKWLALYLITFKNKNFSHLFDGVVYSVFLSLGFAAAENVRYAVIDGWDTFFLRSVTSVPAHMIFGIVTGVCYTVWHTYKIAVLKEKILEGEGVITIQKPCRSAYWLIISFVLPFVLHGFYSFAEFYTSDMMKMLFYVFIVTFFALCFVFVRWLSAVDSIDDEVAFHLLSMKYPQLKNRGDTTLDDLEEMERSE
ncbi:MAG: PrsW family intramembrane metalloprotease [Clostridia bacterium]|nr:PrsW family intramembrane metalloprotease [Clostridia bacterium]